MSRLAGDLEGEMQMQQGCLPACSPLQPPLLLPTVTFASAGWSSGSHHDDTIQRWLRQAGSVGMGEKLTRLLREQRNEGLPL